MIRLLAIIEARTVTGPAKNLLQFCRSSRQIVPAPVETTIASFHRTPRKSVADQTSITPFVESARAAGITVHFLRESCAFDLKTVAQLRKLVAETQADIIQTHAVKSHFLMRLSGLYETRPWVAFHHGYTATDIKDRAYSQLDRWSLRSHAHIIAVSDASRQQLVVKHIPSSSVTVLHNAVDSTWLCSISEQEAHTLVHSRHREIAKNERIVLGVGRFSREKGFVDLIAAIREIRHWWPMLPVRLILLGDGPERRRVETEIRTAGLHTCVTLAGHVNDVRPYYRVAHAVAIPSYSEGSPNVLLEAMAAGVPVAATWVGGITEIAQDKQTALFVPPGNASALAEAIVSILSNPVLAASLSSNAQALVTTSHSPVARTKALIDFYGRICSAR